MKPSAAGLLIITVAIMGCDGADDGSRRAQGDVETPAGGANPAPEAATPGLATPVEAVPPAETSVPQVPMGVVAGEGAPLGAMPSAGTPDGAAATGTGPAPDPDPLAGAGTGGALAPAERTFFLFERPEHVRGIYVNAWSAGSRRRMAALTDLARRTEINSFVIDIKDATGYVSHRTAVPLAREIGATGEIRIPSMTWLLTRLEEAGIYPIARIVIVKDPILAAAHPELAVQDTAGGVWADNNGTVWLNPFNHAVWDYHVALAREVAEMGFPEIQWDYVRFPDAPASALGRADFPGREGRPRTEAIRGFLAHSRAELSKLGVAVTADVFGVTTSATRDVGIGQVWESFIDVVDVALPMVYPSHYWKGSFGYERPNAHPYEIVRRALEEAVERSAGTPGAGATRPWLQDFTLGAPRYEAPEVRAQIQAAYDAGIEEWILWNPGSRYTEAALAPAGGFAEEPMVRIANEIVPVSRRFELFDTVTVVTGGEGEGEVADSVKAAGDTTDTTRVRRSGRSGSQPAPAGSSARPVGEPGHGVALIQARPRNAAPRPPRTRSPQSRPHSSPPATAPAPRRAATA